MLLKKNSDCMSCVAGDSGNISCNENDIDRLCTYIYGYMHGFRNVWLINFHSTLNKILSDNTKHKHDFAILLEWNPEENCLN